MGTRSIRIALLLLQHGISIYVSAQPAITEYAIPTANSSPTYMAAGPDGALWFTEESGNKIGRITTAGVVTEYQLPTAFSRPLGITAGPDGALWFTEASANKIGRITTAGVITEYLVPGEGSVPFQIATGPDGALWFTEQGANKIGRITTAGVVTEYPIPTLGGAPGGIAAGPDGALWFTEAGTDKIGRITAAGLITEYPLPTLRAAARGIVAGIDGALWFVEMSGNKIGRISTAGNITEYPIPTAFALSSEITLGPDGALWFTQSESNKIGRITTTGVFTEYPIPTAGAFPAGIVTGPDGALWFVESQANKIGRGMLATSSLTTITTSPVGLQIVVDGAMLVSPQAFTWVIGSNHTISVASPQGSGEARFVFTSWTDEGTQTHDVTVSAAPTRITALFKTQYLLTTAVSPPGAGTVSASPSSDDGFYDSGTIVLLTAAPADLFQRWSGSISGVENPQALTMSGSRAVTANFVGTINTTVMTNPSGLEIVVDGVTLKAPQVFAWFIGSSHSIGVASPQGSGGTRYAFTSWSNAGAQNHTITVSPLATTITASFKTQYLLTTRVVPGGVGAVSANPPSTDGFYDSGTNVQLTASPANLFQEWSGDAAGAANPLSVVMNLPRSITANFGVMTTITTDPSGLRVIVDGDLLTAPQNTIWTAGSNHTISVSSPQTSGATRFVFTSWSDGGAQTHAITASSTPTTITANFKTQYLLTTTVSPAGAGTVSANPSSTDGFYDSGSSVQLTASPAALFRAWAGDLSGSTNPQSIMMGAPRAVTATFGVVGTLSLTGLSNTSVPTQSTTVGVALSTASTVPLDGTLTLTFQPNAAGTPADYRDPNTQFASGGTTLNFTIPAGSTIATLPQNGAIQQGTVAGTITVTLTRLAAGGANLLPTPAPSQSLTIPRLAPVIVAGTVRITGRSSSGFNVEFDAYSTPRDLTNATFSFQPAAGAQLTGTSFTIRLDSLAPGWFSSNSALQSGSSFHMAVPFTFTGDIKALGGVSVTLTNSQGTSGAESGS